MCGRIDQGKPIEHYVREWPSVMNTSQTAPKYNVSPGTYRPILHRVDGKYQIEDLHWGYEAVWAAGKVPLAIHTRLEKISGKYWKHENAMIQRKSGMMVSACVDNDIERSNAMRLLEAAGATDLELARGTIVDGDWIDFDPLRPPVLMNTLT